MSYILDALRRAEAERERGSVPGLGSRPMPLAGAEPERPHGVRHAWPMVLAVLVLLAAGAAALWWWRMPAEPAVPAAAVVPPVAPPLRPPPPPMARAEPAPQAAPAALPSPPTAPPVQPAPAPRSAVASPMAPPTTAPPPPAAPRAVATPGTAVPPSRPAELPELPADQRRQLPPLAVSGAVYAQQRAERLLIINGRVLREGDEVAPGIVLARIGQRQAELHVRGQRLMLDY